MGDRKDDDMLALAELSFGSLVVLIFHSDML